MWDILQDNWPGALEKIQCLEEQGEIVLDWGKTVET